MYDKGKRMLAAATAEGQYLAEVICAVPKYGDQRTTITRVAVIFRSCATNAAGSVQYPSLSKTGRHHPEPQPGMRTEPPKSLRETCLVALIQMNICLWERNRNALLVKGKLRILHQVKIHAPVVC